MGIRYAGLTRRTQTRCLSYSLTTMLRQGLLRGQLRQSFSTEAARSVIANRSAVKSFKPDAVPDAVLADILRLTQAGLDVVALQSPCLEC